MVRVGGGGGEGVAMKANATDGLANTGHHKDAHQ